MNQLQSIDESLLQRVRDLEAFIGKTPLFPLHQFSPNPNVKIYAKLEWMQLGGSVKARPAYNIIRQAIESGELWPGRRLLDATSGNTGIAYASICSALNIPLTIIMPENASKERKMILSSLGAELIYTSRFDATDGSQAKALELSNAEPLKYYYADQYANEANWKAHYETTSHEIINQTKGEITHFIAGLGTTGTFVGTSRGLKVMNPTIQCISLQPETALHGLEGWKHLETAKVPNFDRQLFRRKSWEVSTTDGYEMIKRVAANGGLLLSPSAGANLAGAIKLAGQIDAGHIVTIFADNAEKYSDVLNHLFP